MKHIPFLFLVLFTFLFSCSNDSINPEYKKFTTSQGNLNYRMLFPNNFNTSQKYPLMIFLHGIGERGNDNESQLTYVNEVFLNKKNHNDFPAIVVFPQSPLDDNWSSRILTNNEVRQVFPENEKPTRSLELVMKLMDSLSNENYIDNNKIYLSGLSNGGMGSFELLKHRPNMFASAVIICGGGNPEWAKEFAKSTPVWIAHGSNDKVVYPDFSLKMAEAIISEGGSPRITFYENVYHDSWNNVFDDPEYLKWIHSHSRN